MVGEIFDGSGMIDIELTAFPGFVVVEIYNRTASVLQNITLMVPDTSVRTFYRPSPISHVLPFGAITEIIPLVVINDGHESVRVNVLFEEGGDLCLVSRSVSFLEFRAIQMEGGDDITPAIYMQFSTWETILTFMDKTEIAVYNRAGLSLIPSELAHLKLFPITCDDKRFMAFGSLTLPLLLLFDGEKGVLTLFHAHNSWFNVGALIEKITNICGKGPANPRCEIEQSVLLGRLIERWENALLLFEENATQEDGELLRETALSILERVRTILRSFELPGYGALVDSLLHKIGIATGKKRWMLFNELKGNLRLLEDAVKFYRPYQKEHSNIAGEQGL